MGTTDKTTNNQLFIIYDISYWDYILQIWRYSEFSFTKKQGQWLNNWVTVNKILQFVASKFFYQDYTNWKTYSQKFLGRGFVLGGAENLCG